VKCIPSGAVGWDLVDGYSISFHTPLGWATEKNKLCKKRSSVTFSGSWMGLTVFFVYVILLEQEETLLNSLFLYVEDHPTQPMSIK